MTDLVADHEVQFLQAQLFDFLLVRNRKIHIFLLDTDFKFPTPTSRLRSEKVGIVGIGRERSGKVGIGRERSGKVGKSRRQFWGGANNAVNCYIS